MDNHVDAAQPVDLPDDFPVLGADGMTTIGELLGRPQHPVTPPPPATPAPKYPEALVEEAMKLVVEMGETYRAAPNAGGLPTRNADTRHYAKAREIQRKLPPEINPVEAIVNELMAKDCTTRQAIEEAVMRGRALADAGEGR